MSVPDPNGSLVRNEKTKLSATYLNGLAIAVFAIGGLAPIVSSFYGSGNASNPWALVILSPVCFIGSGALHWLARRVLAGLNP